MTNMSRIINGETSEHCKLWQAPKLQSARSNGNNRDYKSSGSGSITHSEHQELLHNQAYEKGYEKGYMEGLAQGQYEIKQQVGNLQSLMAALVVPLPELDDQVVDEMVQLCMAMVKQMVRRELKISPGEVVAVVREALSILPVAATEVTLELHPDDAKLIREALTQPENESGWRINEDPLLTRGGCRVLTSNSRIDATVEKRINSVIAQVMGSERKVDSAR